VQSAPPTPQEAQQHVKEGSLVVDLLSAFCSLMTFLPLSFAQWPIMPARYSSGEGKAVENLLERRSFSNIKTPLPLATEWAIPARSSVPLTAMSGHLVQRSFRPDAPTSFPWPTVV
jgi:hypothetical protein